ncbi:putative peptide deformylase [Helianthus annuus]|nr:putative peptide deformylase [Helianthus annuus]
MVKVMGSTSGWLCCSPNWYSFKNYCTGGHTEEYIGYAPKEDIKAQDRRSFDLLASFYVIINPNLQNKGNKSALFFKGCLRCVIIAYNILNRFVEKNLYSNGLWVGLARPVLTSDVIFVQCYGHRAMVERFLDVEVTGLDRYGQPMKVSASGWQARILQHECDHLAGTLYVDKMVKRTFRTLYDSGPLVYLNTFGS